jgi:nucleoside-diphosphate-sugar epimerase
MKGFVTGAAGLLGVNLVRALRWEGHSVAALVPPESHGAELAGDDGVEIVHGSAERPGRWLSSLDSADVLFHAAPPVPGVSVLEGDEAEWPTCTFTTGAMLGPGDVTASAAGRWVCEFLRTGNVGPALGGTCVVDARDVALAMMTAADVRATGEFTVAGHYVEFVELLAILEDLTGRRARPQGRVIVRAGAPAGSARAINELGLVYRPVEETLRDVVAWYLPRRSAGLVA